MQKSSSSSQQDATGKTVANPSISLWRNRDYLLLWSGQLVSSMGSQVSQLAFPLLVLALTGSPAQAGFVGAMRAVPYLIFSLPAGALIDRWDRKRVMIICDTGRALSMASILVAFLLWHLTFLQLCLVSVIEGTLFVFFNIAEVACLPRIVSKEQLPTATAQNITAVYLSSLLGSPVGGALYAAGRTFPFLIDAVSYVFSVLSLFSITTTFQEERTVPSRNIWTTIREGLTWLWHQPLVSFMAIMSGDLNLLGAGSTLIIIVLAQHLHASPLIIGLMFTLDAFGGIVGAWIATRVQRRLTFGQVITGMIWIVVVLYPLYAFAPQILILGLVAAAISLVFPSYDVVQFSYRSVLVPDELQGQVNSVFRLIAFGGQPLGLALTGILLQMVGAVLTILFLDWISYPGTRSDTKRACSSRGIIYREPG